jgi:hypothetical protein
MAEESTQEKETNHHQKLVLKNILIPLMILPEVDTKHAHKHTHIEICHEERTINTSVAALPKHFAENEQANSIIIHS